MGNRVTVKQNNFSHGMQSDTNNKNLVGQTQVFGAERIKHYDIYSDNSKLTPNPSFERFNTDTEKALGIVALGGGLEDTIIYGIGKGLSNWFSHDWTYRIELTPDAFTVVDYVLIDLSNLSSDFWDNVNSNGSDVRVTAIDSFTALDANVLNFDSVAETGFVVVKSNTLSNLHIYFGNVNAVLPPITSNSFNGFFEDASFAYTLNNTLRDYSDGSDYSNNVTAAPTYANGRIGTGSGAVTAQSAISTTRSGTTMSMSFHVRTGATPSFAVNFADSNINLRNVGSNLHVRVDASGGETVDQSTGFALSNNTNYYVSVSYQSGAAQYLNVHVNGTQVFTTTAINNPLDDAFGVNNIAVIGTNSVAFAMYNANNHRTATQAANEGAMMSDPTFFTAGSLVNISSIDKTYAGIGIYYKDIAGTEWKEEIYQGNPIKDVDSVLFPLASSFGKDVAGFFFLCSTTSDFTGVLSGGRAAFDNTLIDTTTGSYTAFTPTGFLPVAELAADKEYYVSTSSELSVFAPFAKTFKYFNDSNAEQTVSYDVGWTQGVYDPFPQSSSLVRYGNSLAIGGFRNNISSIELWNLLGLDSETVIEMGTGQLKVMANVQGSLIAVVDNFLTSSGLSNGNPSLDFRNWTGQDSISTLQSFKFPVDTTTYTHPWQSTLDNRRISVRKASIFQAEPQTDWKGLWAIGIGELDNQLGISIPYDTEPIGRALSYHSAGNNVLFITEDLEIHKVNNDGAYTATSVFDTMDIDAGLSGVTKDIVGVEIVLDKEIPSGQTVTLKYAVDGGAFETIGTCTGRVTEFMFANGAGFNNFNNVQLRIESTGGDASIVEWSLKVEYEQEVV